MRHCNAFISYRDKSDFHAGFLYISFWLERIPVMQIICQKDVLSPCLLHVYFKTNKN